jgi:hypothetical protein
MQRVYHTWDKWECYPAGFYESNCKGRDLTKQEAEAEYCEFLRDDNLFRSALERVLKEWPASCEHYLSNENMNRIAWLGQASVCISRGIPSCFRGGFNMLEKHEQDRADATALEYLNRWLVARGEPELKIEDAQSKTEANLY